jgi:hypothetical protein
MICEDLIILKGKKFLLPENRRKILRTWISDETITAENKRFEKEYNELPDSDTYKPKRILEGGIASIVVLTSSGKVIKNAELSAENKTLLTSAFSKHNRGNNVLVYDAINSYFLICDYLAGFKEMEDLSDIAMVNFINRIVVAIKNMCDRSIAGVELFRSASQLKLGPTGYNNNFPKFLDYTIKNNKITKQTGRKLLSFYKKLNRLPKQVIHGDISRKNIMYRGDKFIIIDPKINLGRPFEDLARLVLKGGKEADARGTIKIIEQIKEYLSDQEFKEFQEWIFIYTVSIYVEYIKIEKTEKSRSIAGKIEKMLEYISGQEFL